MVVFRFISRRQVERVPLQRDLTGEQVIQRSQTPSIGGVVKTFIGTGAKGIAGPWRNLDPCGVRVVPTAGYNRRSRNRRLYVAFAAIGPVDNQAVPTFPDAVAAAPSSRFTIRPNR